MATTRSGPGRRPQTPSRKPAQKPFGLATSPLGKVNPKYHTLIFLGLIFVALFIFFGGPIFSDHIFNSSDFLSWESFRPYLDMMDKKGEAPLWIPYIFSGMPGFASFLVTGDRWWDLTMKIIYSSEHIVGFINYPVTRVVFHYFIYGMGMYLLMRSKKAARSTSFFVALAAIFSTWIIIYIMIGHNTKIMVLMTFPYIFLCLEKLIKRPSVLYSGLLILAVHVLWEAGHLQTAFYGACAVGIYLLIEVIGALTDKTKSTKLANVFIATGILVLAAAFAYGMGWDRNMAVQEYLPYSTRGAASITVDPQHHQSAMEVGQGYDYSTRWSFSPGETFTYLVPGYFGFGKVEYNPSGNAQSAGHQMLYWGQMDFTDAAHYMGIAVLVLGVFGLWVNRRNRFVQTLIGIGLFGLILSFGKNLSILYDLFYNLVPGFSKFRAPSQSLVLLEFVFPILAGYGIESLIAMRKAGSNEKTNRSILYGAALFGVFMLIGLLGQSVLKSSYTSAVTATGKQIAQYTDAIDFDFNMAMSDWIFSGFFGIATLLLMYVYLKGRLTPVTFKIALLGLLLFDLWRIDYRPMETVSKDEAFAAFAPTDVDAFLDADSSKYRIMDLTVQPNYPARHFREHILGYSSAKMRSYQNLLDVAGDGDRPTAPLAQRILNTKYIITPAQQNAPPQNYKGLSVAFQSKQRPVTVYRLDDPLPRAWFVNRVEVLDEKSTLERIRDDGFDPRDVAYLVEPLKEQIQSVGYSAGAPAPVDTAGNVLPDSIVEPSMQSDANGSVKITRYEPLHIAMDVEATGTNFLVISEIHYPPGWKATIDGQPAEIIQTDYLLRGLVVPPGKHTIEMNYVESGFDTGKYMSMILNLVMFGIIIAGVVMNSRKRRPEDEDPVHDAEEIAEDDV